MMPWGSTRIFPAVLVALAVAATFITAQPASSVDTTGSGNFDIVHTSAQGGDPLGDPEDPLAPRSSCSDFDAVGNFAGRSVYTITDGDNQTRTYDGPVTMALSWHVVENPNGTWPPDNDGDASNGTRGICNAAYDERGALKDVNNPNIGYKHPLTIESWGGRTTNGSISCTNDGSSVRWRKNPTTQTLPDPHFMELRGTCDMVADGVTYRFKVSESHTVQGAGGPLGGAFVNSIEISTGPCLSRTPPGSPDCKAPATTTTPSSTTSTSTTSTTLAGSTTSTTRTGQTTTTMAGGTTTTMRGGGFPLPPPTTVGNGGGGGGDGGGGEGGGGGGSSAAPTPAFDPGASLEILTTATPGGPAAAPAPSGLTSASAPQANPAQTPSPPSGVATAPGAVPGGVASATPVGVASGSPVPGAINAPVSAAVAARVPAAMPALGYVPQFEAAPDYTMVRHSPRLPAPAWAMAATGGLWMGFVCIAGYRSLSVRRRFTECPAVAEGRYTPGSTDWTD